MVAYSFQPMFVAPIRARTKIGTIRAHSKKRHARVGDKLQLYCRQRHPSGFKILDEDPTCLRVNEIEFDLGRVTVPWLTGGLTSNGVPIEGQDRNAFAVTDGFKDFDEMTSFWLLHHGPIVFRGVHIIWRDQPPKETGAEAPAR